MLYSTDLTIYTDHKNLTFHTLNNLPSKENVLADCFLRLPYMEKPSEGKNATKGKLIAFDKLEVPEE